MAYQALYRKWRPSNFDEVRGQDHIVTTLKNQIEMNRIGHAYLFCGTRGTGKTSIAKIFAKAVNCEHPVNGSPCNECAMCRAVNEQRSMNVIEIDAASNNGVDNIREIREEVAYSPSEGKYKVYIIDEVHMLSTGAFNALLKTLEEPPAHVIFILATTEVHKLPATILSRCQRFDFKRIQPETMAVRLKQVADLEGLSLDDDAAVLIARIADGALRDGLSILDQCAGRSKSINASLVSEVAGLAGREAMYQLSGCIAGRKTDEAMSIISELYQNSYDMERLCVEMINHFRNFLVVKTVRKSRELIICTDDEYNSILDSAKDFTIEGVVNALDLFQNTLVTIKGGANARIEVEMAFVKLCEPKLEESISSVLDRLSVVERAVKNGVKIAEQAPVQTVQEPKPKVIEEAKVLQEPKPEPVADLEPAPAPTPIPASEPMPTPQPISEQSNEKVEFQHWGEFMDVLHKTDIALFGVLNGSKGYIRGDMFLIDSANATVNEFIRIKTHSTAIKNALEEVTGVKYRLGIVKHKNESDVPKRDPLEDLINMAQGSINIDLK